MWCSFLPPYAVDMHYQFLAAGPSSLHWHLTATVFVRAPSQARMESIERCTPDIHVSEQTWRLAKAHSGAVFASLPLQAPERRHSLSVQHAADAGDTFENAGKVAGELRSVGGEG